MNDEVKIGVSSDSSAARRDIGQLSAALEKVTAAANRTADASRGVGRSTVAGLKEIQAPVKETADGFAKLTRLAIGFASAIALGTSVSGYYRIADELTLVSNRLRLVTKSQFELVGLQRQIVDLSTRTNSALKQTAELYYNINRGAKDSGRTQSQILKLTETIQQSVTVSGTAAETASASINQLNQGLSSGVLRGEELNSVMEGLPRLAQALTDSLGVSAGRLRDIAADGGLTTEIVLNAIAKQATVIDVEFRKANKTVAQATGNFATQFKLLIGTLDEITGSSARLARYISNAANSLNEFTPTIQSGMMLAKTSTRQYIYELRSLSVMALTTKKVLETFSLSQIFATYRSYDALKDTIESMDKLLIRLGLMKAEKSAVDNLFSKASSSMGLDKLFPTKIEVPIDKDAFKSVTDSMKQVGLLVFSIGYAFTGLFDKISTIVPEVFLPVQTATSSLYRFMQFSTSQFFSFFEQQTTRGLRWVEALSNFTGAYTSDSSIERKLSNVFRSDSLVELTANFTELGRELRTLRGGDLGIFKKDADTELVYWKEQVKDVLISLNLMDNRFITLNNIRFDRIANAFKVIGLSIKQVYEDSFKYPVSLALFSIRRVVGSLADTIYDTISDRLSTGNAERLGQFLVGTIKATFKGATSVIDKLFTIKSPLEVLFNLDFQASRARQALSTIANFIVVFIRQIGSSIADSMPKHIRNMVDQVAQEASRLTSAALKHITDFTQAVEKAFFRVYNKVVGNSYWPDLIDGVIWQTSRLDTALAAVKRFTSAVSDEFAPLKSKLFDKIANNKIGQQVLGINYDEIQNNIYRATAAAFSGAILFAFGGTFGKFLAGGALLSFFENTILFPILNGMKTSIGVYLPEEIARALGTGFAIFIKSAFTSLIQYAEILIKSLPSFVDSMLDEFGMLGSAIKVIINVATLGQNGLLYTMLFGFLGYSAITGKISSVIDAVKSVASYVGPIIRFSPSALKSPKIQQRLDKRDKGKKGGEMGTKIFGVEANPTLLIAGIAAVASGFTDAVNTFQALVAGVPLLSFAFLGRDGGAKLIVSIRKQLLLISLAVAKFSAGELFARVTGKSFAQMLGGAGTNAYADFGKKAGLAIFAPIWNLAKTSGKGIANTFRSIAKNKEAFSSGALSIGELFGTVDAASGQVKFFRGISENIDYTKSKVADLKASWIAMQTKFGALGGVGTAISGIGAKISSWASLIKTAASDLFLPLALEIGVASSIIRSKFAAVISSVSLLFTTFGANIARSFSAIAGSTGLVGKLLTGTGGKVAIVALVATMLALFAGTARAAADANDSISTTEKLLKSVLIIVGTIASFFVLIPAATLLLVGYTKGWAAGLTAAKYDLQLMIAMSKALGAAMLTVAKAIWGVTAATYAAVGAPLLTKAFWTGLGSMIVSLVMVKIPAAFVFMGAIIGKVFAAIVLMFKGMWLAIKTTTSLVALLYTGIKSLGMLIFYGLRNIYLIFAAVGSFLGLVGSLVTVAGAGILAVYFFGKGDGFFEKLEYAKDLLFGIFTGEKARSAKDKNVSSAVQDTTIDGKRYEFQSKINTIDFDKMARSEYDNLLRVAESTSDVIKRYQEVVASKGSADQALKQELEYAYGEFNRVAGRAKKLDIADSMDAAFGSLIKTLDDNTLSMGQKIRNFVQYALFDLVDSIPESLISRVQSTTKTIGIAFNSSFDFITGYAGKVYSAISSMFKSDDIEVKTPGFLQRLGETLLTPFKEIYSGVSTIANSLSGIAKDLLVIAGLIPDGKSKYTNDKSIVTSVPQKMLYDFTRMSVRAVELRAVKYWDKASGAGENRKVSQESERVQSQRYVLSGLSNYLSDAEKARINEVTLAYDKALKDVQESRKGLFFTDSTEEVRRLEAIAAKAKKTFEEEIPESIRVGSEKRSIADYLKTSVDLAKLFSDASGETITVEDLIFGEKVNGQLATLSTKIKETLLQSTKTADDATAVKLRIEAKDLKRQFKEVMDNAKGEIFFEQRIDLAIKLTGVDASKQNVLDLFRVNEEGYAKWIEMSKEIFEIEKEIAGLRDDAPRGVKLMLLAQRDAKKQAAADLVNFSPMEQMNKAVGALGGATIDEKAFARIGAASLGIISNFRSLKQEQELLIAQSKRLSIDDFNAQWDELQGRIDASILSVGRLGKSVTQRLVDSLSSAGATADKVRGLSAKQREAIKPKAVELEKIQLRLDTEDLDENTERELQKMKDSIIRSLENSKVFDAIKHSLSERFSGLISESGLDIKLEQMGQLTGNAYKEVKRIIEDSKATLEKINATSGTVPPDSPRFKKYLDDLKKFRDRIVEIVSTLPRSIGSKVTAALEGTGIKPEDFYRLDPKTAKRLSAIAIELEGIERQKQAIMSSGSLTDKDLAEFSVLDTRSRVLNQERVAEGRVAEPIGTRIGNAISALGLSFDDKELLRLTNGELEKLLEFGDRIGSATADYDMSAKSLKDYLTLKSEEVASKKEANALLKRDFASRLEQIGITGVETENIAANIEIRGQLISTLKELKNEYQEYLDLTKKASTGDTSPEDTARLLELRRKRRKPAVLASNAEASLPITNLKELSEALKIDLTDLINIPSKSLLTLRDNRQEITKLFNELSQLGTGEQEHAKAINRKIQERLKIEEDITSQIAERKALADGFKTDFSDGILGLLKGEKSDFAKGITDKVMGTVSKGISDKLFGGLAGNLAKLLTPDKGPGAGVLQSISGAFAKDGAFGAVGDTFREGGALSGLGDIFSSIFGEGPASAPDGSYQNALWVQIKNAEVSAIAGQNPYSFDIPDFGTSDEAGNELSTNITGAFSGVADSMGAMFEGFGSGLTRLLSSYAMSGGGGKFNWAGAAMTAIQMYAGSSMGAGSTGTAPSATGPGLKVPANFKFDKGGIVPGSIGSPQMILAHGGETVLPTHKSKFNQNQTVVNLQITGDISRQTKKEIFEMLPQIAVGVNAHNREGNIRR